MKFAIGVFIVTTIFGCIVIGTILGLFWLTDKGHGYLALFLSPAIFGAFLGFFAYFDDDATGRKQ